MEQPPDRIERDRGNRGNSTFAESLSSFLCPGLRASRVHLHRIPSDPFRRKCVQGDAKGKGPAD